jgi:hypothetical protein
MPATPTPEAAPVFQQQCNRCHETYPATDAYFYVTPAGRMWQVCRSCIREQNRQRRLTGQPISGRRMRRAVAATTATLGTRQFGVEIEFCRASQRQVHQQMANVGLTCDYGYGSGRPGAWMVKPDGTDGVTGELVSPPLSGPEGRRQVELACQALRYAGARVSRACGLHVHFDVNDYDLPTFKRAYRNWFHAQETINLLVSPSRRYNGFCSPISETEVLRLEGLRDLDRRSVQASSPSRYRSLNAVAYGRHGTLEVRQHQGTTDAAKILAWVEFGQSLMDYAAQGGTFRAHISLAEMLTQLQDVMTDATAAYLRRRAAHFSGAAYFSGAAV